MSSTKPTNPQSPPAPLPIKPHTFHFFSTPICSLSSSYHHPSKFLKIHLQNLYFDLIISTMEKSAHRHGHNNPSFSSSLLDAIYRSIDEPDGNSLSSASKKPTTSIEKKSIPKPPPPANLHHNFSFDTIPRPIVTRHDRHCSNPPPEKKSAFSISNRIRNLRNLRAPASPGTRLSSFLNAIFGENSKKPKFAGEKQRSVSFSPAMIDGGEVPMVTRDRRMLLEELLRGLDKEGEESDCESVSSSELFELESISAVGRFRDGLPVYETTNLGGMRATIQKKNERF